MESSNKIEMQRIMKTKIVRANNGTSIVQVSTASAASKWLKKHKQTNQGKSYEKNN